MSGCDRRLKQIPGPATVGGTHQRQRIALSRDCPAYLFADEVELAIPLNGFYEFPGLASIYCLVNVSIEGECRPGI